MRERPAPLRQLCEISNLDIRRTRPAPWPSFLGVMMAER